MSVTTIDTRDGFGGYAEESQPKESWFTRFAERFIEARTKQAEYRVRRHLQSLDKAMLRSLKLADSEIARLQAGNF